MTADLNQEIEIIKERNRKVEIDKAWETSWTRRLFVAFVIYVVAIFWLIMTGEKLPWVKAFWPGLGYLLSTLSLPVVKKWWSRRKSL